MNKIINYIIVVIFSLSVSSLSAQLEIDDTNVRVGDDFLVNLKINKDYLKKLDSNIISNLITFSCDIHISNPTVVYLEKLLDTRNNLSSHSLSQISDSTLHLKALISSTILKQNNNLFAISSIALAGNDSLALLSFYNIKFNNQDLNETSTNIISKSDDGNIIYLRKPSIKSLSPNPLSPQQTLICTYNIDINSDIEFSIINTIGQVVLEKTLLNQMRGTHSIKFNLNNETAMSKYWLIITTQQGILSRSIIIIK